MNTKIKWIAFVTVLLLSAIFSEVRAQVAFPEIIINLSYPQFQSLKMERGYKYIDGGSHGIILYRADENTYVAFERACPHHPYDESATIDIDMSGLYMIDNACKSNFSFPDGSPTAGPAGRAMWIYRVTIVGTTLTISDEIIN